MEKLPIIVRRAWERPATFIMETASHPLLFRFARKRIVTGTFDTPFGTGNRLTDGPVRRDCVEAMIPGGRLLAEIDLTADQVKRHLRRMRPAESLRLAHLDAEVEEVTAKLRELRGERQRLIAEAWSKGHAVTVQEVRQMAGENPPR